MRRSIETPFHDWLVELRRFFHQHPELCYQEEKTAARIRSELAALRVPFESGIAKTGVVARLRAPRPGPVVAFRADMDGLPLEEANDVPYRSLHPGRMHACGHDGHVTIALGVVRSLVECGWYREGAGEVIVIFQPAEEGGAGAKAMLETGCFDGDAVRAVFAGHMHPDLPVGEVAVAEEVSNAASDMLTLRIRGKGGHGAHPHNCVDPIVAAAQLVAQLQTIVSRELPPLENAVLTIGRFHAGTASNIIPEEAFLEGTLRTLDRERRSRIIERIREMLRGLEISHRVEAAFEVSHGYPVLRNDPALVKRTLEWARDVLGPEAVHIEPPRMGSEDFAYFAERWPAVLIRFGCHDPQEGYRAGLHSPHFDFDERVLDVGTILSTELILRALSD